MDSGNQLRGYLWSGAGPATDLGKHLAYASDVGHLNRHGQVAGTAYESNAFRAFVYSGGQAKMLALPGSYSSAVAINDRGQVTGSYDAVAGGFGHSYLYTQGAVADLGELEPGYGSIATSLNVHGQVVGYASVAGGNGFRAFRWSDGFLQDLGLIGPYLSLASDINTAGMVTGETDLPGGQRQAFLFIGGNVTPIGALQPQEFSSGYGMNNALQVVGASSGALERGFLYHSDGVMYDLNALVVGGLGGRTVTSAISINDSGQIAANACELSHSYCRALRLDPFLPGVGTVITNPYGEMLVTGGTYASDTLVLNEATSMITLGPNAAAPGSVLEIRLDGINFAPGTNLTIRAGAPGQTVLLENTSGNATTIAGAVIAVGSVGGAPPPRVILRNTNGIAIGAEGSISSPAGLTLDARIVGTTGAGIVNHGTVDGGANLVLQGSMVNGSGAYKGNAIRISTFGNVNNPVNGGYLLQNGLRVLPSSGGTVALTLNGYGATPQVFNVRVEGNALVSMPSAWPAGVTDPPNNAPVLSGGFRPAGVPDPAYGGGSLIVQATGGLVLDGGVSRDFAFPGAVVLIAGSLDFNGVAVYNGWTTGGKAWQGMYFEAPVITSSAGLIDARTNDNNWINFNVRPNVGVRAWQLKRIAGGAAQFAAADSVAPHLNTYSTLVEIAASGGCWTCTVNPTPVNMY
jgi:probable HAF family extracellular repeat protein